MKNKSYLMIFLISVIILVGLILCVFIINCNNSDCNCNKEKVVLNTNFGVNDFCDMIVKTGEFKDIVTPKNTTFGNYSYYAASNSSNTYFEVTTIITNLYSIAKEPSELCKIKLIYDNHYIYDTKYVIPRESNFNIYKSVQPLETLDVSFIVEIPKILKETDKPLSLIIIIQEKIFEINLR